MQTLNEHIKKKTFKNIYLLYGEEAYLRKQYKNKLRESMIDPEDQMNYNYFEGKNLDVKEILSIGQTMPFFSDHRLIIIENSGFFSSAQEEMTAFVKELPADTYMVFVEAEVDKRQKLYKAVNEKGVVVCLSPLNENSLIRWIGTLLGKEGKKVKESTVRYLISMIDTNMDNVCQEVEKLVCYTYGRDEVTVEDVKSVCIEHTENKIFDMINAVAAKDIKKALELYDDLLILKEAPLKILYLMTRQFNQLLQIRELMDGGAGSHMIADYMKLREFIVKKNMGLAKVFTQEELKGALEDCANYETMVKTGGLNDKMAVELLIHKYSSL